MGEVASSFVSIVPSAKGFGGKLQSQIGGDFDKAGVDGGKRMGAGMKGGFLPALKGLMGPVAALFAVGAVTSFFKSANDEARESQKVGAITANAIKVTGGAAKITAGQVGDLATAISNKTGMDDEAIQSGANLLLTFKNVRNEVGKGSDVFNRATAAAADLSAAGFGDVAGASKMLGKALNDPIKGISAMSRAGVTFTAGQKKQIEGMVKAGDVLGAQKIIMGEVEAQVGGAAAASATAGEKLATTWGNFKETIGTALLPIIDKVMGKVSVLLGFLISNVGPAFGKVGDAFKFLFSDGADGAQSFGEIVDNIFGNSGKLVGPMRFVGEVIKEVVGGFKALVAAFQAGGDDITSSGFAGIMERIGLAARGIVDFFTNTVVPGVKALVAAFTAGGDDITSSGFAGVMEHIGNLARMVFGDLSSFISGTLLPAWDSLVSAFKADGISGVVKQYLTILSDVYPKIVAMLTKWAKAFWAWIGPMIPPAMAALGKFLSDLWAWFAAAWPGIQAQLLKWGKAFVDWIGPMIPPVLAKLGEVLVAIGSWIWSVGLPFIISNLAKWAGAFLKWISPMIPPMLTKLGELLAALGSWLMNTGLPALVARLKEWGIAFLKWIGPMILPMLAKLGELQMKLTRWIIAEALPAIIKKLVEWQLAFLGWVAGLIVALPGKLAGLLGVIVKWAASVPGKIISGLGDLGSLLYDKGKSIIQGLINGLKSMIPNVGGAMGDVMGKIAGFLPGSPVKEGPLRVLNNGYAGGQIVKMLAGGVDAQRSSLQATMASLVQVPRVGSLDFATPAQRAAAVGGVAADGGNADLLAEVQGLRADIRALPKTYQMGQRQYVGAR